MSQGSESGSSFSGQFVFPMLVHCDLQGRVLWMSRRTRTILRDPKQLMDIIVLRKLRHPNYGLGISFLRFWKVCEFRDSVLIGAIVSARPPQSEGLASLQVNLSARFYRLLELERSLFERVRRHRRGTGKKAVRQIELERQRLGRELHTGVGQMLAAIRWQVEVISTELPSSASTNVQQALESIATLTAESLKQVRGISKRLHPPEWQRLTLESAVRQLWEISGIPQRLAATLDVDPLPSEPDLEVKVLVYRAFQEALSNLARHAQATRIDAALRVTESGLVLSIQDNGVGFDAARLLSSPPSVAAGIGLRSIREMTASLGGKFEVESSHSGTKLVITVALHPAEN